MCTSLWAGGADETGACVPEVFPGQLEICFTARWETEFLSEVRVAGSSAELGSWNPLHGVPLTDCDEYPYWRASVWVTPSATGWEYKFVVVNSDDSAEWECGQNRTLAPPTMFDGPYQHLQSNSQEFPKTCHTFASSVMDTDLFERTTILFEVLHHDTSPGDKLIVAGATETLGSWEPCHGLQLSTCKTEFPLWRGITWLRLNELSFAWKLICQRVDGHIVWESCENRQVSLQPIKGDALDYWLICVTFGGAHKDPVPCRVSHGSIPQQQSIASQVVPNWVPLKDCGVDINASTCLTDEYAEPGAEFSPQPKVVGSFHLWSGAHQKQKDRGHYEDAYFQGDHALGVADGVGGMIRYANHGVDSAAYASELMNLAAAGSLSGEVSALPQAVAALSHAEQCANAYGASTALVLALKGDKIGVASLGDSGFLLLRRTLTGMAIIERTQGQQHSWNHPYQFVRLPASLAAKVPKGFKPDSTEDCERLEVQVDAGDLLLLFTDGLSDNLHEHELLEIVNRLGGTAARLGCPQALARELVLAAYKRSRDPKAQVPFTISARKEGRKILGGKKDDITAVAAWIV